MFDICSFYKDISVTSLTAMKTDTPADTDLNSCVVCLVLFIASQPRKLKGCFGEGVSKS